MFNKCISMTFSIEHEMEDAASASSKVTPFPYGAFCPGGLNTDPAISPNDPTIGYKFNHTMIRVRDPKESLKFYVDLMGMRTVFTMNAGPFTNYYLGYPQTDDHRADPAKFGADTSKVFQSTIGLLELFHVHGSEKQEPGFYHNGNTPESLGFGHMGFTVPDARAALARLNAHGVKVFKDFGVANKETIPISDWENEHGVGVEVKGTESELHPMFKKAYENIALVQDPVSLSESTSKPK
ncbi:hypothetical protein HYE67_002939 [Fusarium culmorum]|uniref:VOC domain-containing protein n=1 Tax=Fusarium culmorum TaxID=5516 RepID=A0A7S8D2N7_FUSCU|nr:hypothetical protein HYE67_002939 [Fusarium culmorum]